ncbi:MAG: hypothetical protein ACYCOR_14480 [Acidobacteriaceae bacterium]
MLPLSQAGLPISLLLGPVPMLYQIAVCAHGPGREVAVNRVVSRGRDSSLAPQPLLLYPVEEVDALPSGDTGEGVGIEASQA